jgi:hypothetical protein
MSKKTQKLIKKMGPQPPKSKVTGREGPGRGRGGARAPKNVILLIKEAIKVNVDSPQQSFERLPPGEEGQEGKTGVRRGRGGWGGVGGGREGQKLEKN